MPPLHPVIFYRLLDETPLIAWTHIANMYLEDLLAIADKREITLIFSVGPEFAVNYLGKSFYKEYTQLYSFNKSHITYPNFDDISTEKDQAEWKETMWNDITNIMSEVSYTLRNYLEYTYDSSIANDFYSLCPKVDTGVIYSILLKNLNDPEDSESEHTDPESEYELDY